MPIINPAIYSWTHTSTAPSTKALISVIEQRKEQFRWRGKSLLNCMILQKTTGLFIVFKNECSNLRGRSVHHLQQAKSLDNWLNSDTPIYGLEATDLSFIRPSSCSYQPR